MSFPYVCLHCNLITQETVAGKPNIQCHCGKTAWSVRCNCAGQVDERGVCVKCAHRRG